jgi:hypothetical protein
MRQRRAGLSALQATHTRAPALANAITRDLALLLLLKALELRAGLQRTRGELLAVLLELRRERLVQLIAALALHRRHFVDLQ